MAFFTTILQDVSVSAEQTHHDFSKVADDLQKDLRSLEDSEKPIRISREELEKLVLLLSTVPSFLKGGTSAHDNVCNAIIDLLNIVLECSLVELNARLFKILASATGPILLDVLMQRKHHYSHFPRRLAETFSILMTSICNRITSETRFLEHVQFVLAPKQSLGKFLGECGSFLVQANVVEALVKLTQKLLYFKLITQSKVLVSDICYGILDFQQCKTHQIVNLSSLFISIVRDVEKAPTSTVHRIRCWLNMANDMRAKFKNSTIASFLSKKSLVQNEDMFCTAWVDFNLNDLTITGCEFDNHHTRSDPVALALSYTSITDVIGNRDSSTVSIHVSVVEDLWENSKKDFNCIVFEFARSDLSFVFEQFKKRNIKLQFSEKRSSTMGVLKKFKLPKEFQAPCRKASITFSSEILEKFLNTTYRFTTLDSANPSGGVPIPQMAFQPCTKGREFIESGEELSLEPEEKVKSQSTDMLPLSEPENIKQTWKKQADEFQQQFFNIQKKFAETATELIQTFLGTLLICEEKKI